MWPVTEVWGQLVSGDHEVTVEADAFYDGEATAEDLAVTEGSWSQSFDGSRVRSTLDLTIADPDGEFAPVRVTDPLAAYGQQIVARVSVGIGRLAVQESIPLGTFRIESSDPEGGWRVYQPPGQKPQWVPTGGTVKVQCSDLMQDINDHEQVGLMQPRVGGTVHSELTRLLWPILPVDLAGVPDANVPQSTGVYADNRLETVDLFASMVGRVPAITRAGQLTLLDPSMTTHPVKHVTVQARNWVGANVQHSREGIWNAIVVTGEGDGETPPTIRATRLEQAGPFRWGGPVGSRVYRQSSPLYKTQQSAEKAANTLYQRLRRERSVEIEVRSSFDPSMDVLDTHRVTIIPGEGADTITVDALLIGVSGSVLGGEMTCTYSVPREAVQAWTR